VTSDPFLERFLARARTRLSPMPPDGAARAGDAVTDPSLAALAPPVQRPAAVLIALVARAPATILLTRRTETLPAHKGQIAFPGGRVEVSDRDATETALREAEEEIGLHRTGVEIVGHLDVYRTTSGFDVVPVVGLVRPPLALAPNPGEVAEVFEVPLAFLMDPANHEEHEREWQGRPRRYLAMPYGAHYIWGVTAGILRNLYERVEDGATEGSE